MCLHGASTISSLPSSICQHPCPDCAEVWASFAPLSQATFAAARGSLSLTHPPRPRSGLLHLQVFAEDRQQAVHVGEERLRDDPERRVQHHPLRGQLRRAHGAVRLCRHQRPGEQGEGQHCR